MGDAAGLFHERLGRKQVPEGPRVTNITKQSDPFSPYNLKWFDPELCALR
jgi:hypothetical protein